MLQAVSASVAIMLALTSFSAVAQAPQPVVTVATPLAEKITRWDEFSGRFEVSLPRKTVPSTALIEEYNDGREASLGRRYLEAAA